MYRAPTQRKQIPPTVGMTASERDNNEREVRSFLPSQLARGEARRA